MYFDVHPGHFSEYYGLSESRQDGFFLRKNPVSMVILDYILPENAVAHVFWLYFRHGMLIG